MLRKILLQGVVLIAALTTGLSGHDMTHKTRSIPSEMPRKAIVTEELHVYMLLQNIKLAILELDRKAAEAKNAETKVEPDVEMKTETSGGDILVDSDPVSQTTAYAGPLKLVNRAINLLHEIIDSFNDGNLFYNPEIEYKFVNACNFLSDIDGVIEPRHVRSLIKNLKKVTIYVSKYSKSRKESLCDSDLDLFNKIIDFNRILTGGLLCDDYLSLDYIDTFMDRLIYRPWEFACENKELTIAAGLVVTGLVFYFWVLPKLQDRHNISKILSINIANKNDTYDVSQYPIAEQNGVECGYHTLYYRYVLKKYENDIDRVDKVKQEVANYKHFDQFCTEVLKLTNRPAVHEAQLNQHLEKLNLANHTSIISSRELLNKGADEEFREGAGIHFQQIRAQLARGEHHSFIVNTGSEAGALKATEKARERIVNDREKGKNTSLSSLGMAHWFLVDVATDPAAKKGIRFTTLDSYANDDARNRTNDVVINQLAEHLGFV